jgi:hypothetical protein
VARQRKSTAGENDDPMPMKAEARRWRVSALFVQTHTKFAVDELSSELYAVACAASGIAAALFVSLDDFTLEILTAGLLRLRCFTPELLRLCCSFSSDCRARFDPLTVSL